MSVASAYTTYTPLTGTIVNLTNNNLNLINPAGTISSLTLSLPSSPNDGDRVVIKFTQAVTTLSYSNGTVVGNPTSASPGTEFSLTYLGGSSNWQ